MTTKNRSPGANRPRPIHLALQGGGPHRAFTWGVVDRLLEDGRLAIDGVSATRAGAMNAVAPEGLSTAARYAEVDCSGNRADAMILPPPGKQSA